MLLYGLYPECSPLTLLQKARLLRALRIQSSTLVVITRGISDEEGADGRAFEDDRRKEHAALASLSRNGKDVIAARSGHHVQLDEPEIVVTAIQQVVAAARK